MELEKVDVNVTKVEKITRINYGEIKAPLVKWSPKVYKQWMFSSESPKDCSENNLWKTFNDYLLVGE